MSRKQMVLQVLVLSLLSASACSHFRRGGQATAARPAAPAATQARVVAPAPKPAKPVAGPTDANIVAMVLAANNTDISYARLVPSRAQTPAVKEYANQMLADNTGVNRIMNDFLTRIKLSPEDNAASLSFRDESAARRDQLRAADAHAFDATYMANEVVYHSRLLASIDNTLLPSVRSPELRQLLTSIRPAVAAHLAHAQQLQAGLASR